MKIFEPDEIPLVSWVPAKEAASRINDLETENQWLRDALPPPDRLRLLADWFDCNHWSPDTEVQDDLRRWAEAIEKSLGKET